MMNPLIWPGGNCTPLAKKELLYTGPFGIACWLSGITFIDRLNREKSRSTMNNLAKRVNEENVIIQLISFGIRVSIIKFFSFYLKKNSSEFGSFQKVPETPKQSFYHSKKEPFIWRLKHRYSISS